MIEKNLPDLDWPEIQKVCRLDFGADRRLLLGNDYPIFPLKMLSALKSLNPRSVSLDFWQFFKFRLPEIFRHRSPVESVLRVWGCRQRALLTVGGPTTERSRRAFQQIQCHLDDDLCAVLGPWSLNTIDRGRGTCKRVRQKSTTKEQGKFYLNLGKGSSFSFEHRSPNCDCCVR